MNFHLNVQCSRSEQTLHGMALLEKVEEVLGKEVNAVKVCERYNYFVQDYVEVPTKLAKLSGKYLGQLIANLRISEKVGILHLFKYEVQLTSKNEYLLWEKIDQKKLLKLWKGLGFPDKIE